MSIYTKLVIVFLAFIIIPVLFVSYIVFYNAKNSLEKQILSKLNMLVNEEAEKAARFTQERITDVYILGKRDIYETAFPALDKFSQEQSNPSYVDTRKEINRRFDIFHDEREYSDMELINMEGKVIYVFSPEHQFEVNETILDKDAVFRKAKEGVHIGDVVMFEENKEYRYVFYMTGQAYGESNKIIGLVRLGIDIKTLNNIVQDSVSMLGNSGEVLLVKKVPGDKVMYLSKLKYDLPQTAMLKEIAIGGKYALAAQKAALGEKGMGVSIDYRGKEVLASWRSIPLLGWGLVAKIDTEEAYMPIRKLKDLLIVVVSITIISTMLAAFTIANSISSPIQELRKGVGIIGSGNLDYRIGIEAKDEIGELSQAFDRMAQSLKKTTTSIDALNKEIIVRKEIEEELNQSLQVGVETRAALLSMLEDNNQIREKLEQYIEKLNRAQDILVQSEKLASLGKLVSAMAHEVNNPLMTISGNAQLSLMTDSTEEEIRNSLKIIVDECFRAKNIIQRLLKFSRPSKGQTNNVDINTSLEALVGIVERQFKLGNVEIKRNYQENLPLIPVDEQQIQEVFMNLINNASEAMSGTGVIIITTSLEGDFLRVDVKDNGSGIPEEVKKKVFDPFFTTKEKGTGLGLSICYGIIKAYNGELKLESELGKGTTFTVLLPLGGW